MSPQGRCFPDVQGCLDIVQPREPYYDRIGGSREAGFPREGLDTRRAMQSERDSAARRAGWISLRAKNGCKPILVRSSHIGLSLDRRFTVFPAVFIPEYPLPASGISVFSDLIRAAGIRGRRSAPQAPGLALSGAIWRYCGARRQRGDMCTARRE